MEVEIKITKDNGDTKVLKLVSEQPLLPKPSKIPSIRIDYETVDVYGDFGFVKQKPTGYARVEIFGKIKEK